MVKLKRAILYALLMFAITGESQVLPFLTPATTCGTAETDEVYYPTADQVPSFSISYTSNPSADQYVKQLYARADQTDQSAFVDYIRTSVNTIDLVDSAGNISQTSVCAGLSSYVSEGAGMRTIILGAYRTISYHYFSEPTRINQVSIQVLDKSYRIRDQDWACTSVCHYNGDLYHDVGSIIANVEITMQDGSQITCGSSTYVSEPQLLISEDPNNFSITGFFGSYGYLEYQQKNATDGTNYYLRHSYFIQSIGAYGTYYKDAGCSCEDTVLSYDGTSYSEFFGVLTIPIIGITNSVAEAERDPLFCNDYLIEFVSGQPLDLNIPNDYPSIYLENYFNQVTCATVGIHQITMRASLHLYPLRTLEFTASVTINIDDGVLVASSFTPDVSLAPVIYDQASPSINNIVTYTFSSMEDCGVYDRTYVAELLDTTTGISVATNIQITPVDGQWTGSWTSSVLTKQFALSYEAADVFKKTNILKITETWSPSAAGTELGKTGFSNSNQIEIEVQDSCFFDLVKTIGSFTDLEVKVLQQASQTDFPRYETQKDGALINSVATCGPVQVSQLIEPAGFIDADVITSILPAAQDSNYVEFSSFTVSPPIGLNALDFSAGRLTFTVTETIQVVLNGVPSNQLVETFNIYLLPCEVTTITTAQDIFNYEYQIFINDGTTIPYPVFTQESACQLPLTYDTLFDAGQSTAGISNPFDNLIIVADDTSQTLTLNLNDRTQEGTYVFSLSATLNTDPNHVTNFGYAATVTKSVQMTIVVTNPCKSSTLSNPIVVASDFVHTVRYPAQTGITYTDSTISCGPPCENNCGNIVCDLLAPATPATSSTYLTYDQMSKTFSMGADDDDSVLSSPMTYTFTCNYEDSEYSSLTTPGQVQIDATFQACQTGASFVIENGLTLIEADALIGTTFTYEVGIIPADVCGYDLQPSNTVTAIVPSSRYDYFTVVENQILVKADGETSSPYTVDIQSNSMSDAQLDPYQVTLTFELIDTAISPRVFEKTFDLKINNPCLTTNFLEQTMPHIVVFEMQTEATTFFIEPFNDVFSTNYVSQPSHSLCDSVESQDPLTADLYNIDSPSYQKHYQYLGIISSGNTKLSDSDEVEAFYDPLSSYDPVVVANEFINNDIDAIEAKSGYPMDGKIYVLENGTLTVEPNLYEVFTGTYNFALKVILRDYTTIQGWQPFKITSAKIMTSEIENQTYELNAPALYFSFEEFTIQPNLEGFAFEYEAYLKNADGMLEPLPDPIEFDSQAKEFTVKASNSQFEGTYTIQLIGSVVVQGHQGYHFDRAFQSVEFNLQINPYIATFDSKLVANQPPRFEEEFQNEYIITIGKQWQLNLPDIEDDSSDLDGVVVDLDLGFASIFVQYDPISSTFSLRNFDDYESMMGTYNITITLTDLENSQSKYEFNLTLTNQDYDLSTDNDYDLDIDNDNSTDTQEQYIYNEYGDQVDDPENFLNSRPVKIWIEQITVTGEVKLKFDQELKLVNMIEYQDIASKRRKLSSNLSRQQEVTPFNISVIPGLYSDPKNLTFEYEVINFDEKEGFDIQLYFNNHIYVSSQTQPDQLNLTLTDVQYFKNSQGMPIQEPLIYIRDLPTQIPPGSTLETVTGMVTGSLNIVFASNSVSNTLLVGSLSYLMRFILFMQIGSHFPLVNLATPGSAMHFNGAVASVVSFDFYEMDDTFDKWFNYQEFLPISAQFDAFGLESSYFPRNAGMEVIFIFISILLVMSIVVKIVCCNSCLNKNSLVNRFIRRQQLQWNYLFRFLFESYMPIQLYSVIQLKKIYWNNLGELMSLCLSGLIFLIFNVFKIAIPIYFLKKHKKGEIDEKFVQTNGGLLKTLKRNGKMPISMPLLQMLRIDVFCLIVMFLDEYPKFQITTFIWLSVIMIIILGQYQPYVPKSNNNMEMLNEICLVLMTYHFLCFTDFVTDQRGKEAMSWSLIGITSFIILLQLVIITVSQILTIVAACKKRKQRKIQQIRQSQDRYIAYKKFVFLKQMESNQLFSKNRSKNSYELSINVNNISGKRKQYMLQQYQKSSLKIGFNIKKSGGVPQNFNQQDQDKVEKIWQSIVQYDSYQLNSGKLNGFKQEKDSKLSLMMQQISEESSSNQSITNSHNSKLMNKQRLSSIVPLNCSNQNDVLELCSIESPSNNNIKIKLDKDLQFGNEVASKQEELLKEPPQRIKTFLPVRLDGRFGAQEPQQMKYTIEQVPDSATIGDKSQSNKNSDYLDRSLILQRDQTVEDNSNDDWQLNNFKANAFELSEGQKPQTVQSIQEQEPDLENNKDQPKVNDVSIGYVPKRSQKQSDQQDKDQLLPRDQTTDNVHIEVCQQPDQKSGKEESDQQDKDQLSQRQQSIEKILNEGDEQNSCLNNESAVDKNSSNNKSDQSEQNLYKDNILNDDVQSRRILSQRDESIDNDLKKDDVPSQYVQSEDKNVSNKNNEQLEKEQILPMDQSIDNSLREVNAASLNNKSEDKNSSNQNNEQLEEEQILQRNQSLGSSLKEGNAASLNDQSEDKVLSSKKSDQQENDLHLQRDESINNVFKQYDIPSLNDQPDDKNLSNKIDELQDEEKLLQRNQSLGSSLREGNAASLNDQSEVQNLSSQKSDEQIDEDQHLQRDESIDNVLKQDDIPSYNVQSLDNNASNQNNEQLEEEQILQRNQSLGSSLKEGNAASLNDQSEDKVLSSKKSDQQENDQHLQGDESIDNILKQDDVLSQQVQSENKNLSNKDGDQLDRNLFSQRDQTLEDNSNDDQQLNNFKANSFELSEGQKPQTVQSIQEQEPDLESNKDQPKVNVVSIGYVPKRSQKQSDQQDKDQLLPKDQTTDNIHNEVCQLPDEKSVKEESDQQDKDQLSQRQQSIEKILNEGDEQNSCLNNESAVDKNSSNNKSDQSDQNLYKDSILNDDVQSRRILSQRDESIDNDLKKDDVPSQYVQSEDKNVSNKNNEQLEKEQILPMDQSIDNSLREVNAASLNSKSEDKVLSSQKSDQQENDQHLQKDESIENDLKQDNVLSQYVQSQDQNSSNKNDEQQDEEQLLQRNQSLGNSLKEDNAASLNDQSEDKNSSNKIDEQTDEVQHLQRDESIDNDPKKDDIPSMNVQSENKNVSNQNDEQQDEEQLLQRDKSSDRNFWEDNTPRQNVQSKDQNSSNKIDEQQEEEQLLQRDKSFDSNFWEDSSRSMNVQFEDKKSSNKINQQEEKKQPLQRDQLFDSDFWEDDSPSLNVKKEAVAPSFNIKSNVNKKSNIQYSNQQDKGQFMQRDQTIEEQKSVNKNPYNYKGDVQKEVPKKRTKPSKFAYSGPELSEQRHAGFISKLIGEGSQPAKKSKPTQSKAQQPRPRFK